MAVGVLPSSVSFASQIWGNQNVYVMPNCRMRGVPAMDVTRPNADELRFTSGTSQLTVLNRLNASTRSATRRLAPSETTLASAASTVQNPGPRTLLRRTFPNVPGAGSSNASGVSQSFNVLSAYGLARTWLTR